MLQVSNIALQKLKYIGMLLASDGRKNKEIDTQIDTQIATANAVLCELYQSVTKRQLSNTAKLSVLKLVFVPILTYDHES